MKFYISGDTKNVEQFNKAERWIKLCNHQPINSATLNLNSFYLTNTQIIKAHFDILATCDYIYMLKGWQQNKKAKAELAYAKLLGIKVKYEDKQWALRKQQTI